MRWICKDDVEAELKAAWRQRAAEALALISAATSQDKRKEILKKTSSAKIWRDYYDLLPANLKKKCWYCEAEEIRSDVPVDHFRPKGEVEDDNTHEGYWWLAFDWENYRCACTFCNSRRNFEETEGGKACKFPLVDPGARAYSPAEDLALEVPDFLDPFEPDDEKLLWFDDDGCPEPKPESTDCEARKVKNSIDIFHLNETKIVRKRNSIRIQVERYVETLRKGNAGEVRTAKSKLKKMVRDTEMLSRAAIVYLRPHRALPAVKEILDLD
jgi:uncharacterized protein (TIGR02646 family)